MTLEELCDWHRPRVTKLIECGVDVLAFETIPAIVSEPISQESFLFICTVGQWTDRQDVQFIKNLQDVIKSCKFYPDCRMTRTSCLYTHSDCRITIVINLFGA